MKQKITDIYKRFDRHYLEITELQTTIKFQVYLVAKCASLMGFHISDFYQQITETEQIYHFFLEVDQRGIFQQIIRKKSNKDTPLIFFKNKNLHFKLKFMRDTENKYIYAIPEAQPNLMRQIHITQGHNLLELIEKNTSFNQKSQKFDPEAPPLHQFQLLADEVKNIITKFDQIKVF